MKRELFKYTIWHVVSLIFIILVFTVVCNGQTTFNNQYITRTNSVKIDTSLFQDMHFRTVGPLQAGRVVTVSGIPGKPSAFYMGPAVGAGVWRTDDYGVSWRKVSDDQVFKSTAIGAIAVARSDTSTVYVGTGSCGIRDIVLEGRGVYKTTDSGKHWSYIGLKNAGQICKVIVDPHNPDRVFVAALGHAFGHNKMRGIFRSTNGGKTWQKVLYKNDSTGASAVAFTPGNSNILYAGLWRGERKGWNIISGGGPAGGIYKSTDGGDHWHKLTNGLPKTTGKIGLAVTPAAPNRVYALVEAPTQKRGLYESNDRGKHWHLVNNSKNLDQRPFYFTTLTVDPNNADIIYIHSVSPWKSTDGGKTFHHRTVPHGDTHDLWINPNNSDIQILGGDGGAAVTVNGGKTWSTRFNQPTAEIWQVHVDDRFPYWLYGGQQDEGTSVVPSLPPYPTVSGPNSYLKFMGGCETGPSIPVPNSPLVYNNCKGQFTVYNRITGQEKNYDIGVYSMYGFNTDSLVYEFARDAPIEISPNNPGIVYMGAQYVFRSTNGGKNWKKISPNLTVDNPKYQMASGTPITRDITGEENFSSLQSIQVSPLNKNIIWAGSNDGMVSVSKNYGKTWTNVTPKKLKELEPNGQIHRIEPSHFDEGTAYIAVERRYLDDFHPYIFKTTDYGEHWTLLTSGKNGIPANYPTRVVREDPVDPNLLYAGTDWGLFISFDGGMHWQPFKQGLPKTAITDIKIHANDLILSTYGRGYWILDDVSVLRQIPNVNTDINYLFNPVTAYRMRYSSSGYGSDAVNHGDIPQYPPPGATIDFYLAEGTQTPVVLKFKDSQGNLVQRYVGIFKNDKDNKNKYNCSPISYPDSIPAFSQSPCFRVHPGHNRFRWDMRYPGKLAKGMVGGETKYYGIRRSGPLVVPGQYSVQISAGNWSSSRPLTIKEDPRVVKAGVTQGDMQAQLQFNLDVLQLIGNAKILAAKLKRSIKKESSIRKKHQLQQVYYKLVTNHKIFYPPAMLIGQAQYLYRTTTQAEQHLGGQAYKRYKQLLEEFNELKKKFNKII